MMTREEAQEAMACGKCVYFRKNTGEDDTELGNCYYERHVWVKLDDDFCSDHAQIVGPSDLENALIYEGLHEDGTDN
jgi:hypothetical protein